LLRVVINDLQTNVMTAINSRARDE
jgi:hypothetical protein